MDFLTFYCGIREYFSSHKTDFECKAQIKVTLYMNNAKGTVVTRGLKYDSVGLINALSLSYVTHHPGPSVVGFGLSGCDARKGREQNVFSWRNWSFHEKNQEKDHGPEISERRLKGLASPECNDPDCK